MCGYYSKSHELIIYMVIHILFQLSHRGYSFNSPGSGTPVVGLESTPGNRGLRLFPTVLSEIKGREILISPFSQDGPHSWCVP